MKRQTGVRVDVEVWEAYKGVCAREELRPSGPIEGFLKVVVEDGSALSVLRLLRGAVRVRVESLDDYAQVLLSWYKGGRRWVYSEGREVSVDAMLLFVLREVSDPRLRKKIRRLSRQSAMIRRARRTAWKSRKARKKKIARNWSLPSLCRLLWQNESGKSGNRPWD
jgi:hypothetical protein